MKFFDRLQGMVRDVPSPIPSEQAREFHRALLKASVSADLVYIPRQSHISEMVHVSNENDLTVAAALRFMK